MSDRAVAIDRSIIEKQALIRFCLNQSGDSPFDNVRAAVRIVTVRRLHNLLASTVFLRARARSLSSDRASR